MPLTEEGTQVLKYLRLCPSDSLKKQAADLIEELQTKVDSLESQELEQRPAPCFVGANTTFMEMSMRKVQVFKNERGPAPSYTWRMVEDGTALFHQFGVDHEEFETGPGNYTTAIIEREDGAVQSVPANFIKFLEPSEST